ncbi:hypothetical protein GF339_18200 [candidate division KSB3 bacterium]|uniref:ParB/Sulfiredoxin domain-containing protein n=1 Tax=candidate division KSB3 bacterium TaxID=2044937 RepID=A0A9D5JYA7_9BACT|nr:hypothetical protein [candidate division KSB3 bacterium]MBD3326522.1 hypothetical protein [candidate division KSB3 bacterium]
MSEQVHVQSIQALVELRSSVGQFRQESLQSLDVINKEIRRFEDWLLERQRYWQYQIEQAQEMLYYAQRALEECQASGYYDEDTGRYHAPNCSGYEMQVAEAYRRLRQAEEELHNVMHWKNLVGQAVHDYQRQARRLADQLNHTLPQAGAFLGRKLATLEAYRAEHAPTAGQDIGTASSSPTISSATGRTASYGADSASLSVSISAGSASGTAKNAATGVWKDHGVPNVPVQHLIHGIDTLNSHVKSKADFKKVSYEEMAEGLRKLQEVVLPAVQNGADGDYFSDIDAQQSLDYEHGYRRIYDAFYGNDAIRVNKIGDAYQVINGYHRLFVAKELGIESLPVQVVEHLPSSPTP